MTAVGDECIGDDGIIDEAAPGSKQHCSKLRRRAPTVPVIMIIDREEEGSERLERHQALKTSADAYLVRPFTMERLAQTIDRLVPGVVSFPTDPEEVIGETAIVPITAPGDIPVRAEWATTMRFGNELVIIVVAYRTEAGDLAFLRYQAAPAPGVGAPSGIAPQAVGGGALAFYLWVRALERTTPTLVANTMTVNPIAAALLAAVLVNEPITLNLVAGLVAVFAGIWIATTGAAKA